MILQVEDEYALQLFGTPNRQKCLSSLSFIFETTSEIQELAHSMDFTCRIWTDNSLDIDANCDLSIIEDTSILSYDPRSKDESSLILEAIAQDNVFSLKLGPMTFNQSLKGGAGAVGLLTESCERSRVAQNRRDGRALDMWEENINFVKYLEDDFPAMEMTRYERSMPTEFLKLYALYISHEKGCEIVVEIGEMIDINTTNTKYIPCSISTEKNQYSCENVVALGEYYDFNTTNPEYFPCSISTDTTVYNRLNLNCFMENADHKTSVVISDLDKRTSLKILEAIKRDDVLSMSVMNNHKNEITRSLEGGDGAVTRIKEFCSW